MVASINNVAECWLCSIGDSKINIYESDDMLSVIVDHMHIHMEPLRDAPEDSPGLHPASDLDSKWKIKKHLLCLATIKHARVDEVRTHNCGLDAIFSGRQQLQTN